MTAWQGVPIATDVLSIDQETVLRCDDEDLVVVAMPDGMSRDSCARAMAAACLKETLDLERDAAGLFWMSPIGRIDLAESTPTIEPDPDVPWRSLRVLGHGDCTVTLDLDGTPATFDVGGRPSITRDRLNARLKEVNPVGTMLTFQEGRLGGIAKMQHPRPTNDALERLVLEHVGIDVGAFAELIAKRCLVVGSEFGTMPITTPLLIHGASIAAPLPFKTTAGHVACQVVVDGVQFTGSSLLVPRDMPETLAAALVGRPLSTLVALPFDHHDPTILSAENNGTFLGVGFEETVVPLAA